MTIVATGDRGLCRLYS